MAPVSGQLRVDVIVSSRALEGKTQSSSFVRNPRRPRVPSASSVSVESVDPTPKTSGDTLFLSGRREVGPFRDG